MDRGDRRTLLAACFLLYAVGAMGLTAAESVGTRTDGIDRTAVGNVAVVERSDAKAGQNHSHDSIVLTQEFRLTPSQPGRIDIQWHFYTPDSVSNLRTRLPQEATNIRTNGFTRENGRLYEWSAENTTATITFTLPANRTTDAVGPGVTNGSLKFIDAGDWALTRLPSVTKPEYNHRGGDPGVTLRNTTRGEGVIGQALVFLGPHETFEREAYGQRFRLVVPEEATPTENPETILDSVVAASDKLRVGARDSRVLMVAAPSDAPWGPIGFQAGQSDFYVLTDALLYTPANTWVHEYVHTRQDFETSEGMEWFYEATAEYYAALLTLEQDRTEFRRFQQKLEAGTSREFTDVRLIEKSTWGSNGGNYIVGALVSGELDRRIRITPDGNTTFQDVFRQMNRADQPVNHSMFLEYVHRAGGDGVVDPARRFTETTERPGPWSKERHQEAFGALPTQFTYKLPDRGTEGVRVRGQYREGTLEESDLVVGETLVIDVAVTNGGEWAGEYDLTVNIDGERVANRTGRLDAGGSTIETVEYTFDQSGQYMLSTGEENRTIKVDDPATPFVTELAADPTQLETGESVRLVATVENPADRPANGPVVFTRDGSEVTRQRVRLGPGEVTEMAATVSMAEPGSYRFGVGDRSVTVTVTQRTVATPTATAAPTGTETGASGPGFGPLMVLVALAVFVLSVLAGRPTK